VAGNGERVGLGDGGAKPPTPLPRARGEAKGGASCDGATGDANALLLRRWPPFPLLPACWEMQVSSSAVS
jgi:hypothetical protein